MRSEIYGDFLIVSVCSGYRVKGISSTTLITPAVTLSVITEDEPDNRVLECAAEGQADYIISGDEHHLQPLREYEGIPILSPTQFLELFE